MDTPFVETLVVLAEFATMLRTLRVLYETKHQQFCANLASNLLRMCATPPSRTPPPFSGLLV